MEPKADELEKKISAITAYLKDLGGAVSEGFTKVGHNFNLLDNKISMLDRKINVLNDKVDSLKKQVEQLKGDTSEGFDGVGVQLETLNEEISKIGKVTRYEELFKNLEAFGKS